MVIGVEIYKVIGNDERVELRSTIAQNVENVVVDVVVINRAITGYIGDVGRLKGDSNVEEGGMQSDNKFDLLVDVVDGREKLNLSPKKSRLIDGGWLI
ncbi:hypothetical protein V6N12_019878 [Hibiscus sabdariffa]|uniref:Uncharacterized protein n=1 Tax=Hibiscus sabdariffa TaxID=183260 RepID=A0ABR2ARS9_9ROSI